MILQLTLENFRKNTMFRKLLPIAALLPVAASAYLFHQPWFGILALLAYLLAIGLTIGPRLTPNSPRLLQLGLGIMSATAAMSLLGSLVYYSATVTTSSLFVVLAIIAVSASLAQRNSEQPGIKFSLSYPDLTIFTLGLIALAGWWLVVATTHVTDPFRSVWLVLSPTALIAIAVAAMCTVALFIRNQASSLGSILLIALIFSATSIAAVVYTLGYGFDPFLHRATVSYIAEHGTITPKPLYYIGQYALELIGLKLFALQLFWLDVLLAPVLAAIGVTTALAARQTSFKAPSLVLAALLFLPLAAFVQTTPQALAFVFTAWAVLAPPRPIFAPLLFALAAVITHPLAGIGALIYVILLAFDSLPERYRTFGLAGLVVTSLGAAVSIPLAFVAQAELAHLDLNFSILKLAELWKLPVDSFLSTNYNAWGDLTYLFIGNAFVIVLVLAIIGVWLTPKTKRGWYIPGLVALAMLINFWIISLGFDFNFLISYERLDFALRLLTLTTIFLLPYIAIVLAHVWDKLKTAPPGLRLGFVVLLSIVFTANVYGAYPRHDNYARSSGFNLGPADIEAVKSIEISAEGQPYIVLSDQALAAAAVQELGFKQYYHDDIFFYPIPTGGPLYQKFLTMVEEQPSRETILEAMDLAGVDLAFFAIHDYWWQAPQIIENSKVIADDWFSIEEGAVTVFTFSRSSE